MNCKDVEQEIYLYNELTPTEKKVIDNHIESCVSCREHFAIVQQTRMLVSKEALSVPQPKNFSKLTSHIMQAIEVESQQKESRLHLFLSSWSLKYSMAAASLALILGFGFESLSSGESITKGYPPITKHYPSAKTVTLNSNSLAKSYRDKKSQPEKTSLYACAKSGDCNNTFIENFKKKSL